MAFGTTWVHHLKQVIRLIAQTPFSRIGQDA
jgi:hypothetical protein